MPKKRRAQDSGELGEQVVKRMKDDSTRKAKSRVHIDKQEREREEEEEEEEEAEQEAEQGAGEEAEEEAEQDEGQDQEQEDVEEDGPGAQALEVAPSPKRRKRGRKSSKSTLEAQTLAMATALEPFQIELTALRLEVEMVRVQREQQRQWNKSALALQKSRFEQEIERLKNQVKWQDEQRNEIELLKAEMAELKASIARTTAASSTGVAQSAASRDSSLRKDTSAMKPQVSSRAQPSPAQAEEVKRIKKSIRSRHKSWAHFISQEGNYMFATNLENGLGEILREIRHFNIDNPQLGLEAFELITSAVSYLHPATVAGWRNDHDRHSLSSKLAVWQQMDDFGALLLQGVRWQHRTADLDLKHIEDHRLWLAHEIKDRLEEFQDHSPCDIKSWLSKTTAGLKKCIKKLDST